MSQKHRRYSGDYVLHNVEKHTLNSSHPLIPLFAGIVAIVIYDLEDRSVTVLLGEQPASSTLTVTAFLNFSAG